MLPCRSVVLRIVICTRSGTKLRATSTRASSTTRVMNEYKNGERFFIAASSLVSPINIRTHQLLSPEQMPYGNSTARGCQKLIAVGGRKWQRADFNKWTI